MIVVVSDGLRSTSHGLNFKIFLGEHAPRLPYKTVHAYSIYVASVLELYSDVLQATNSRRPGNETNARTDICVLRAPHQSPLYMPPLLQSLDPPLLRVRLLAIGSWYASNKGMPAVLKLLCL